MIKGAGFFTENGVIGMLEASDLESSQNFSLFLWAIVDQCFKESGKAPITIILCSVASYYILHLGRITDRDGLKEISRPFLLE